VRSASPARGFALQVARSTLQGVRIVLQGVRTALHARTVVSLAPAIVFAARPSAFERGGGAFTVPRAAIGATAPRTTMTMRRRRFYHA
jgi:hypothetical protein